MPEHDDEIGEEYYMSCEDYNAWTRFDSELCDLECRIMKRIRQEIIPQVTPVDELFQ